MSSDIPKMRFLVVRVGYVGVLMGSVLTPEQFRALASSRTISTSTAFSGIGCSETADEVVASGCQQILEELGGGSTSSVSFEPEFAIEWKAAC